MSFHCNWCSVSKQPLDTCGICNMKYAEVEAENCNVLGRHGEL